MHYHALCTSLAFVVTLTAPRAQGFVSPAHFATVEGTGNGLFPFGTTTSPFRYQQIHDDVPAQVLVGLAFRHDTTGAARAPFSVTIDAWLSTAAVTSGTASATFDNNHGPDKLQVVTNRTLSVPANDPAQLPGPFLLDIPFDPGLSFAFAGPSLCWEVQVTARTNVTNIPFDAVLTQGSTPASPGLLGTSAHDGCLATGRTLPMSITPANSLVDWASGAGNQSVNAHQLEANGVFAWVTGTNTAQWAGIPLPAILPSSVGAPSGTCTLLTDLALLTIASASPSGTAQLNLGFHASASLHGYLIYTQVLGLDAAANAIGLTTSNLVIQQLVAPYPVSIGVVRVYAPGNQSPTGTISASSQLVTKFY